MERHSGSDGFQREGDALAAADAQGDNAAFETIPPHRVNQAGRQHRSRRTDRVPMGDGAALDVDDVFCKSEFLRNRDRNRRESLVDFNTLEIRFPPSRALQSLPHRRDRTKAEQTRLDGRNAKGNQSYAWV